MLQDARGKKQLSLYEYNITRVIATSQVVKMIYCSPTPLLHQRNPQKKTALPLWRDTPLDQSVPRCLRSSTSQSHVQWRISQHLRGDIKKTAALLGQKIGVRFRLIGFEVFEALSCGIKNTDVTDFFSMALQGLEAFSTSNRFDKFSLKIP